MDERVARPEARVESGAGGLELVVGDERLAWDFSREARRLAPAALSRELLVRAARVRGLGRPERVLDCTAGLGEDSLLLAGAGFEVALLERNPLVEAVLADAIARARESGDARLAAAAGRMEAACADSLRVLETLAARSARDGSGADGFFGGAAGDRGGDAEAVAGLPAWTPDVAYLDPMFPAKRKDALAKKKLQMLQALEPPCDEGAALLAAARTCGARRVVVKRPAKGPWLGDAKPSRSLAGKTVRYDVYECVGG